ncbi:MAG: S8 family serine peptidase, partial [Acidobacteriota bacterium]
MFRTRNPVVHAAITAGLFAGFVVPGAWGEEDWLTELQRETCSGRVQIIDAPGPLGDAPDRPVLKTVHGDFAIETGFEDVLPETRGQHHWLICLRDAVSTPFRLHLEKRGIRLLQYIPENCWKASLSGEGMAATLSESRIRAVNSLCARDKLSAKMLGEGLAPRSRNLDGSVSLVVTFFADVDFGGVLRTLQRIGATTHQREFLTGSRVQVTLSASSVPKLAHADEVSWIENRSSPAVVENEDAAALSRIDEVRAPPLNLDGSGIRIGEWDAGEVQAGHHDFGGRVVVIDHSSVNSHSTHVAGTLMGDGSGSSAARGMAPGAELYSYDFAGDELAEMAAATASYGISVSSNSWGYIAGWHSNWYNDGYQVWFGDEDQGAYNGNAQAWDQTVVATGLLISKSAGNDRDDFGDRDQTGHHHYPDGTTLYTDYHPPDGPWDCVGDIASAKNVITVGALMDSGEMTEFSAWGPCDDGRIKPDITANGYGLWSTCPTDT